MNDAFLDKLCFYTEQRATILDYQQRTHKKWFSAPFFSLMAFGMPKNALTHHLEQIQPINQMH